MAGDGDTGSDTGTDADRAARPTNWRAGDVPAWTLALGVLLVVAAALGLASLGGAGGIVGVAVLLAAVIALLYSWCAAEAPAARRD